MWHGFMPLMEKLNGEMFLQNKHLKTHDDV
jgi:hypothetical protein